MRRHNLRKCATTQSETSERQLNAAKEGGLGLEGQPILFSRFSMARQVRCKSGNLGNGAR